MKKNKERLNILSRTTKSVQQLSTNTDDYLNREKVFFIFISFTLKKIFGIFSGLNKNHEQ